MPTPSAKQMVEDAADGASHSGANLAETKLASDTGARLRHEGHTGAGIGEAELRSFMAPRLASPEAACQSTDGAYRSGFSDA